MDALRWTTVFEGPAPKAAVLRSVLESRGIETFVPDELTKLVDPFITGPNVFQVRLQVPEPAAAQARDLLRSEGERVAAALASRTDPDEEDPEDEDAPVPAASEEVASALDSAALRTILLTALILTTPLALISFGFYLRRCRQQGARSRLHTGAVAAFVVALAVLAAVALYLAKPPRSHSSWLPERPPIPHPVTPIGPR